MSEFQECRDHLKVFLKGSKVEKQQLKSTHPDLYDKFQMIWKIRSKHMVSKYPAQYVFQLIPCFESDCCHPVCNRSVGASAEDFCWYEGGPPITYLPFPVPDSQRPWGSPNCPSCKGFCSGHYLQPSHDTVIPCTSLEPPSTVIYNAYKSQSIDDEELARKTCLPTEEVKIWLEHLHTVSENRKRGAKKLQRLGVCDEGNPHYIIVVFVVKNMKMRPQKKNIG